MVPNGWRILSLGEICNNNLQTGPFGSQLHAHEYVDAGVSVVMPKDLINNRVNLESTAKIPQKRADDLKKHYLKSGDIIFSRRGDVSRFALIDDLSEGSICGTGCLKATPSTNHSSEFLSYFLQRDNVKQWLEQNAVGQTMLNINTEILSQLPLITASSIDEEKKIVTILSAWDKAIEVTKKLISNSQTQKKALMQQLLTGKKRLLDENGERFSGEWKNTKISYFLSESKKPSVSNDPEKRLTVRLHLKGIEAREFRGTEAENSTNHFIRRAGQFIYGRQNFHKGAFGIIPKELDLYESSQDIPCFDFSDKCSPLWFFYMCSRPNFYEFIENLMTGTGSKRLHPSSFLKIKFATPSLKEQAKISTVLSSVDREIELLDTKLEFLKQEKKALMQQLLTGKRRVKVDN